MSRRKGKRSGWRSPARKPTPPVRVRPHNEPSDLTQTRAVAEEIIELAEQQAQADGVLVGVLWDLIATMAIDRAGLTKEIANLTTSILPDEIPDTIPMDAAERKRFGSGVMDFGKHRGTQIQHVPVDYLQWADHQMGSWWHDLRRYLKGTNP